MLPRGLGKELIESSAWVAEYGWGGGRADVLMPEDVSSSLLPSLYSLYTNAFIGHPAADTDCLVQLDPKAKTTSMEEYIRRADWSPLFGEKAKA